MTVNFSPRLAFFAAAAGLCLASLPAAAVVPAASAFTGLWVFGDSLSDNGRVFAASGVYPPAPYVGGRFSNGPVASEVLATGLWGANSAQFHDLAYGGARTGVTGSADGLVGVPTGMTSQLSQFNVLTGGAADSNALYMVWGGANDLRDGLSLGTQAAIQASITAAISNLVTIVSTLHAEGAHNFLLPNLPDLGITPEGLASGGAATASFVSGLFNQNLAAAYGSLAASWTDEHFYLFDAMTAQHNLVSGSPGNGFSNVTQACITTAGCNPAQFLYWDSIHPTAAAHAILGAQMLAAVPEPGTMLMMSVGVLALLGLGRRRQA